MRARTATMKIRHNLLISHLVSEAKAGRLEHEFESLAAMLGSHGDNVAPLTVRNTLSGMPAGEFQRLGMDLTVGSKSAKLVLRPDDVFSDRMRSRPDVKEKMGKALCHFLFRSTLEPDGPLPKDYRIDPWGNKLRKKVLALRQKSPLHFMIDAGSTTLAFTQGFLDEEIPLRPAATDGARKTIVPTITTNCIRLAQLVAEGPHRNDIGITLIGGELRVERGSICGSLTNQIVQLWRSPALGGYAADVAVIGATGYRDDMASSFAFGSDNLDESMIKTAMLSMCWLRIVLIDSSKLANAALVSKIFASLQDDGSDLDLVVTDDGDGHEQYQEGVRRFREAIRQAGTSALITSIAKDAAKDEDNASETTQEK